MWSRLATPLFADMQQLAQQMDALFEGPRSAVLGFVTHRGEDALTLTADLPGLTADDLELTIEGRRLTLRTTTPEDDDGWTTVRDERPSTTLRRTFLLPPYVDVEEVSATFTDGVFTLTLPLNKPKARHIPVVAK